MTRSPLRHAATAALSALALVVGLAIGLPAAADHTEDPARVTLMGSLMSELGCTGGPNAGDWDESCELTDMSPVAGTSRWELTATLPAGEYEFKVRLNGSWDENYGAGGVPGGPNLPLALQHAAALTFSYDHASHRVGVAPAVAQPGLTRADRSLARSSLREDLTHERFYFVMADRFANGDPSNDDGGLSGTRLDTGLDPTHKGFYHGGDLKGLLDELDYIEGLGTTAIWMTPSFKNKPVQGAPGTESAGYHGYWITDFTQIDPHLGTNAELKQLVDAAHARGIKVFFDIITNHTADVLDYTDEAYAGGDVVPYKSKAEAPYVDTSGTPFDDRDYALGNTFPPVDNSSFPYEPVFRAPGDEVAKTPDWLNDPTMFHTRGTSSFTGENSEYGDFPGGPRQALDDLWTERPEVVNGMIDIYEEWVQKAGVDGFRIDTVKHVNMEFWQRFGPALEGYAASVGNDDFFMFGEVFDANPEFMSRYTTTGKLQATVDFGFQAAAQRFAQGKATTALRDLFAGDDWFTDADSNAYSLPTFLGNHDMGRIGRFIATEGFGGNQLVQRDELAHSLMYLTRGQPVVYYGDEQGFVGDGGDQDAREDMFPSQVASYNDNDLIGTDATTAAANFDTSHPLYRHIADLSALRAAHPTLADGAQVHRFASDAAGIYAFSRIRAGENVEYVVAANNADAARTAEIQTFAAKQKMQQVWPTATRTSQRVRTDDEGRLSLAVPARSVVVYEAEKPLTPDSTAPAPFFTSPGAGGVVGGRAEIGVGVPGTDFNQVTVAYRPVGAADWTVLGTDDNAPYRVFHDVRDMPRGSLLEYRAVVRDHDGDLGVASTYGIVGDPPAPGGGGGDDPVGPVDQPAAVSIPGSHGSEIGCPDSDTDGGTDPGDWDPACEQAQLALDANDDIWKTEVSPNPEGFAFKAAVNRSWDENYGAGGVRNGGDIGYTAPGGPIRFYYDHRTHWATNDVLHEIVTAAGSFQSEMGCSEDWQPSCMRAWLQDPNDDDVYTLSTVEVPAGTWAAKATVGLSWDESYGDSGGNDVVFTVAEGDATTFRFDRSTNQFSVSTAPATPPDTGPDLSVSEATWATADLVAWDVAGDGSGRTYRLYWGAPGSLTLDAETIQGGSSVPLTLDPAGLPPALVAAHPDLEGQEALRVRPKDKSMLKPVWRSGGEGYQVAVAEFDRLGRLVDATGVVVTGP
jgi:glycosidase